MNKAFFDEQKPKTKRYQVEVVCLSCGVERRGRERRDSLWCVGVRVIKPKGPTDTPGPKC